MDCTQVLESDLDDSVAYTYKVKVAELRVNNVNIDIFSGSNRIGRDPEFCSVVFDNKTLSKEHAVIEVENRYSHLIYDLGSKNKTKLGKLQLKPHVRYQLMNKSEIQFGDLVVEYAMMSGEEEEGGRPFAVIEDSDDEVIPATPAVSKESTRSREDSPTIFELETECPVGYEDSCARVVTDSNDLEETNLPEENGLEQSSAVEDVSTVTGVSTDGDETDPEDSFCAMNEKSTEESVDDLCVDTPVSSPKEMGEKGEVANTSCGENVSKEQEKARCTNENEYVPTHKVCSRKSDEDVFNVSDEIQEESNETVQVEIAERRTENQLESPTSVKADVSSEDDSLFEAQTQIIQSESKESGTFKVPLPVEKRNNQGIDGIGNDKDRFNSTVEENTNSSCGNPKVCDGNDALYDAETQILCAENTKDISCEMVSESKDESEQIQGVVCDPNKEDKKDNVTSDNVDGIVSDKPAQVNSSPLEKDTEALQNEKNDCSSVRVSSAPFKVNNLNDKEKTLESDLLHTDVNDSFYEAETQIFELKQKDENSSDLPSTNGKKIDEKVNEKGHASPAEMGKEESVEVVSENVFNQKRRNIYPLDTEDTPDLTVQNPDNQESNIKTISEEKETRDQSDGARENSEMNVNVSKDLNKDFNSFKVPSARRNEESSAIVKSDKNFSNDEKAKGDGVEAKGDHDSLFDEPTQVMEQGKEVSDLVQSAEGSICQSLEKVKTSEQKTNQENDSLLKAPTQVIDKEKEVSDLVQSEGICQSLQKVMTSEQKTDQKTDSLLDDPIEVIDKGNEASYLIESSKEGICESSEKVTTSEQKTNQKNDSLLNELTQVIDKGKEAADLVQSAKDGICESLEKVKTSEQKTNQKNDSLLNELTQVTDKGKEAADLVQSAKDGICESLEKVKTSEQKTNQENDSLLDDPIEVIDKGKEASDLIESSKEDICESLEKVTTSEQKTNQKTDSLLDAPTQVIDKGKEVSDLVQSAEGDIFESLEKVKTSEQKSGHDLRLSVSSNERNCDGALISNNVQSSSLSDDDNDDLIFMLPTQVISKTNADHACSDEEDTNKKSVSIPSEPSSDVQNKYSTFPSGEIKEDKILNAPKEKGSESEETENSPRKDVALNDSFSESSSLIFPPSQVTSSQEEAKKQIKNILNQLEDEEPNAVPESSEELLSNSNDQQKEVGESECTLNNSIFEASTQIAPFKTPEDLNLRVETQESEDSENEPVSDSSFFEAATQIVPPRDSNLGVETQELNDSGNKPVSDSSFFEAATQIVPTRDPGDSNSRVETQESDDSGNEPVSDSSFFEAATQIVPPRDPGDSNSRVETQELDDSGNKPVSDSSLFEAATQIVPTKDPGDSNSPEETQEKTEESGNEHVQNNMSEARAKNVPSKSDNNPVPREEVEDTKNSHALNNSHPEVCAQTVPLKVSKELTHPWKEEDEKNITSENEDGLNDSFFEAATQIVPGRASEPSGFQKEAQETEDDATNNTQIVSSQQTEDVIRLEEEVDQVNTSLSRSSSYSSIHEAATQCIDDLDVSGQTLPVVAEAKSSTKEEEEKVDNSSSDAANKTTQLEDNSRSPENLNDDVELVLPSTQELQTAAELCYGVSIDGEEASTSHNEMSPVIHKGNRNKVGSRRGVFTTNDSASVKPAVARVSFAENETDPSSSKTEPSADVVVSTSKRRMKLYTKNSINKLAVPEDVSNKEDGKVEKSKRSDVKRSLRKDSESGEVSSDKKVEEKDDKRNRDRRNKAKKDSSGQEQSSETQNSRPSRQRKMTWKAQENQDKSQSPDSKGKRDEETASASKSSSSETSEGKGRKGRGQSVKMKMVTAGITESKPANEEIPPESHKDSNLSPRRKKISDPAPTETVKEEKAKREDQVEHRRSTRGSKTTTPKNEAKSKSKKEQTTLDKWCVSPVLSKKSKKTDDVVPVVEQVSRRSSSKHSTTTKPSDENTESVTRNSVAQNKRKRQSDICESPRKRRQTDVKTSNDRNDENKTETSVSYVERSELSIGCSAVRSRRKQNLNSSIDSVEQEKKGSRERNTDQDEKTLSTRRSRNKQLVLVNNSPTSKLKLKPEESETQNVKKQHSQTSRPINTRTTSSSSSSEQEKVSEEPKRGRSKRSIPKIPDEEHVKPRETVDKKRRRDSEICETPKKQRKISRTASQDEQVENVNDNSRRKSNRATSRSNSLNSNVETKDDTDENTQELLLQISRNKRKARASLPLESEDESTNKKGRSKSRDSATDSKVSKGQTVASQNLRTPPRTAKNRSTPRQILSSEKTDKKIERIKNNKEAQSTESDGSFGGSPSLSTSGRKRKLKLTISSTPVESDGQSSQGEGTPKRSSRLKHQVVHRIMFTGIACSKDEESAIVKLGGKIVQEVEECTILITDKIRRTLKLLCIMGQGKPIVSRDWIKKSDKSGQFLDPWNFIVKDKEAEKKFKFQLQKSLKMAGSKKLLEGFSVFVTPSVIPPPNEMKGIVEKSGGQFLSREPRVGEWPVQSFIISTPTDKKNTKLKKTSVPIVSTEILLTGVLQQKLNIKDHVLKL